jgi:hypothetical protein
LHNEQQQVLKRCCGRDKKVHEVHLLVVMVGGGSGRWNMSKASDSLQFCALFLCVGNDSCKAKLQV